METGASFKPTDGNLRPIRARLDDGFTLDQAAAVVKSKTAEWKGTDQAKYLRPLTLFGPKFDGYLQAARHASNGTNGHRSKAVNDDWKDVPAGEVTL